MPKTTLDEHGTSLNDRIAALEMAIGMYRARVRTLRLQLMTTEQTLSEAEATLNELRQRQQQEEEEEGEEPLLQGRIQNEVGYVKGEGSGSGNPHPV